MVLKDFTYKSTPFIFDNSKCLNRNRTSFSNPKYLKYKITKEYYVQLNHIFSSVCTQYQLTLKVLGGGVFLHHKSLKAQLLNGYLLKNISVCILNNSTNRLKWKIVALKDRDNSRVAKGSRKKSSFLVARLIRGVGGKGRALKLDKKNCDRKMWPLRP